MKRGKPKKFKRVYVIISIENEKRMFYSRKPFQSKAKALKYDPASSPTTSLLNYPLFISHNTKGGKWVDDYKWDWKKGKWIKIGIKPSSGKDKGRKLQQWLGQKVADLTGFEFGKDCSIESRPMGQSGMDLRLDEAVLKVFPFSPECKWTETWSVPAAIKQAKENQKSGTEWLVVLKRSHENPVVVMDGDAFFELMEKAK